MREKRVVFDASIIDYSEGNKLYRLTPSMALTLMTVTSGVAKWSTRWLNYVDFDKVLEYVAEMNYRLSNPVKCENSAIGAETVCIISDYIGKRERKTDMNFRTEKIRGTWYMVVPCGDCGQYEYVELGQGIPQLPGGGGPQEPLSGGTRGVTQYPETQSDTTCYANAATDYMLSRFYQYTETVVNLAQVALDSTFLGFDEVVDVAAIVSDVTNNTTIISEIKNRGLAQIQSIIDANRQALIDAWNYTGTVSRIELYQWVDATNFASDGLFLGTALNTWIGKSLIPGYNSDLSLLAQQCNSGNTVVTPPTANSLPVYTDANYELFSVELPKQQLINDTDTMTVPLRANFFGLYIEWTQLKPGTSNRLTYDFTPDGSDGFSSQPSTGVDNHFLLSVGGGFNTILDNAGIAREGVVRTVDTITVGSDNEVVFQGQSGSMYPVDFIRAYMAVSV